MSVQQHALDPAGFEVPEPDRAVLAGRDDQAVLRILAYRQAGDFLAMSLEDKLGPFAPRRLHNHLHTLLERPRVLDSHEPFDV